MEILRKEFWKAYPVEVIQRNYSSWILLWNYSRKAGEISIGQKLEPMNKQKVKDSSRCEITEINQDMWW